MRRTGPYGGLEDQAGQPARDHTTMRLYSAKIPIIARSIIGELIEPTSDGTPAIEVNNREEAELDIQAVLKEFLRTDRELTEQAKDLLEQRKLPHGAFGKVKRMVAEQKGFGLGEEGIIWICNQILETFMQSKFIEEIYASDADMRRVMKDILRRNMMVDEELDLEVRKRIQNLQEGTATWDIEYSKVMEQIKHKRGIKE